MRDETGSRLAELLALALVWTPSAGFSSRSPLCLVACVRSGASAFQRLRPSKLGRVNSGGRLEDAPPRATRPDQLKGRRAGVWGRDSGLDDGGLLMILELLVVVWKQFVMGFNVAVVQVKDYV